MFSTTFYSVVSTNAVCVFDNWKKVQLSEKYFGFRKVKKFNSFFEAEKYALKKADDAFQQQVKLPDRLVSNIIVFKSKLPRFDDYM